MKKFAFFVAVALCLTLCLMIPASAEESAEEPALESEGFRWRLLEDGTAEILKYTGGELRLSNYLLYQCAYSELYFTPVSWPDFDETQLTLALQAFAGRSRRFGQTQEQIDAH